MESALIGGMVDSMARVRKIRDEPGDIILAILKSTAKHVPVSFPSVHVYTHFSW